MPLISVKDDPNDEQQGALINSQSTVFAGNILIIVKDDSAQPDKVFIDNHTPPHDNPKAIQGSSNVFVANKPVHRKDDMRICGASTVVVGQSTVFANEGGGTTSAVFITPDEPQEPVTSTQKATYAANVANPAKYDTPANQENGVTEHPELEDDPDSPPPTPVDPVVNPNCQGGGNMGTALDKVLEESQQGKWKETGSNPNIQALYSNVGFANVKGDQTAWCAAFTGSMLKNNCFKFNKSLAAGSYTGYGNPVDISQAQKGDVVVFNRDGGTGHVAFYYGPGPTPGTIYVVGGNQSNNVTKSLRKVSDLKPNGVQRPMASS